MAARRWEPDDVSDLETINRSGCPECAGLVAHLGILFTVISDDYLEATMPVDARTHQPFGLLHGGASVILAESMGSIAGYLATEESSSVVGVEVKPATSSCGIEWYGAWDLSSAASG